MVVPLGATMVACSAMPGAPASSCGDPALYKRSYALPPRFPFPPGIRLVMENVPGTCDFYANTSFCDLFSSDRNFEPEYHVKEAIASFLHSCFTRRCQVLDLGANNGWFTLYMLSLGAMVLAVEPQADLAAAVQDSAALNCWGQRLTVLNALVSIPPRHGSLPATAPVRQGYRAGGWPTGLHLPNVSVISLDDVLLGNRLNAQPRSQAASHPPRPHRVVAPLAAYDLVKIDVDGPEGRWLDRMEAMMSEGRIDVRTLIIECHMCRDRTLLRLQRVHGYSVFLFNMHVDRRFITARGVDAYRPAGSKVLIEADELLPPFVKELFSVRLLRHIYHFSANMTARDWRQASKLTRMYCNQYVLTKEQVLEPRREHPDAIKRPSAWRRASDYQEPEDGGIQSF